MKRVVDLFAGCGGLSSGFQNAGFKIVGAFEYWEVAADCYSRNFLHSVYRDDLSNTEAVIGKIKSLSPDVIIGGPPCQDFSHAGKRVEASRAGLTGSFAEIVTAIRPKYFVMENVDRAQKSTAYKIARKLLSEAGYGLTEVVLDASYFGVPQRRKRFFCIGSLEEKDGFLQERIMQSKSDKEMTVRDYFGDTLDIEFYYRHPRNYSRRAIFSIDEPAPTVRGVNRPIPQGYPGHPNDACDVSKCTRPLTTLERALVQTFPPDYRWVGSKTDMEQMVGNAVPAKLAEAVAKNLAQYISESESIPYIIHVETIDYGEFYSWLEQTQPFSERGRKDVLSRLRRAFAICDANGFTDVYYRFQLEQSPYFQELSSSVRSQIKKAVTLYIEYIDEKFTGEIKLSV